MTKQNLCVIARSFFWAVYSLLLSTGICSAKRKDFVQWFRTGQFAHCKQEKDQKQNNNVKLEE